MDWSTPPLVVLRLALLLAGLLVPGTMLLRALRLPWSLAAAFVASCATLYAVVLLFACTGFTISLATLVLALSLISAVAGYLARRPSLTELSSSFSCFTRQGPWLPLYAAFWLVVGYRLAAQPLNGPDVCFRWSYLGEQMLQFGSLDFYPPRSGADFARYFWAESVPPGIASLYAWTYACAGSKSVLWVAPVIMLQLLSLHEVIWRLASRWGGEAVARRAVLLAAACPLLGWSVLIGQETGLTALAVVGLVWSLHHLAEEDGVRWAALAGIFAIAAASTREYGPVFAVAAVLAAKYVLRLPRRAVGVLAWVALPLSFAWILRVWLLTGNPLYSLNLGGLFRVNTVFTAWNDSFRAPHAGVDLPGLGRYLLLWALPACAGLVALAVLLYQRLREARIVAVFVLLTAVLWFASVAYTAGGLFYSLRVLAPAFALLAVTGGYAFQLFFHSRAAVVAGAIALGLISLEALPKTLTLPENPYRMPASEWPQAAAQFPASVRAGEQDLLAKLKPLPGRRRVVTDNAGLPRVLADIGSEAIPLWSPDVAWLFDDSLKPREIARRWQLSGFRYVIVGKMGPSADFLRTHARWRAPYFTLRTVAETDSEVILEAVSVSL